MSSKTAGAYQTSRYNFFVPTIEATLLYNSLYGSVVNLGSAQAARLACALAKPGVAVFEDDLSAEQFLQLTEGRFLVPPGTDELAVIKERFWNARNHAPAVLTITTTMDCNLGCYYCYEERSSDQLSREGDVDAIVDEARRLLTRENKKTLHVDWYGGEPLLNVEFLEAASTRLRALADELRVNYTASILSNGTCWPDDVGDFVARHRIVRAQIPFDGLKENHDKRRHYRKGYAPSEDASSFDLAVKLVGELLDHTRVDVRFNIDRSNASDFVELVRFAREQGWFNKRFAAAIQPARLMKFSERSSFMRKVELNPDEFETVRKEIERMVPAQVEVQNSTVPTVFPEPRFSVCAALNEDAVVVGANGSLYRCGLQVGEKHRVVGGLRGAPKPDSKRHLPLLGAAGNDVEFWRTFDPTERQRCSACTFLPVCWSGCPKVHLERDALAIRQQGEYWRGNLARQVAKGLGLTLAGEHVYTAQDQFPDGEPETYISSS
jgi:uncharacterized protein